MTRKSKPWAVIIATGDGNPTRTEHASENKAFEKVRAELALFRDGASNAISITVQQWEPSRDRWTLFEIINPKEWL